MIFKELLILIENELKIIKHTRKRMETGRKLSHPFNPRLVIPIVGENPHAKMNRDRRYKRREIRDGKF